MSAAPVRAEEQLSPALVRQLGTLLTERQLDTIAVRDPGTPDRFVAAMYFPNSQLLLVSGQYSSPAYLDDLIARRQFKDAYVALQQAAAPETRVFFHDMGADGLNLKGRGDVDIVYEQVTKQTIFDGDWKKQKLSEREYQATFERAETQYRRLLEMLLTAVASKPLPGGAPSSSVR
jgi:hypothetical protein